MTGERVRISLENGLGNLNNIHDETKLALTSEANLIKGEWMDVLSMIIFGHFQFKV